MPEGQENDTIVSEGEVTRHKAQSTVFTCGLPRSIDCSRGYDPYRNWPSALYTLRVQILPGLLCLRIDVHEFARRN
jgi:hypothetical protein